MPQFLVQLAVRPIPVEQRPQPDPPTRRFGSREQGWITAEWRYDGPEHVGPRLQALTDGPSAAPVSAAMDIDAELASLDPPRRHYRRFYATRGANDDLWRAAGVHDFLRAYYHMKSGDWSGNRPEPLREWSAAELARLPRYYVMDLGQGDGGDGNADLQVFAGRPAVVSR